MPTIREALTELGQTEGLDETEARVREELEKARQFGVPRHRVTIAISRYGTKYEVDSFGDMTHAFSPGRNGRRHPRFQELPKCFLLVDGAHNGNVALKYVDYD